MGAASTRSGARGDLRRTIRLAAWPLAAAAIYVALHAFAMAHPQVPDRAVPLCVFRAVTGVPCPTCGGTRATLALVSGDLDLAIQYNPLVTSAWLLAPVALVAAVAYRRRGSARGRGLGRWIVGAAFVALAAAMAANWAHVLRNLPELERSADPAHAAPAPAQGDQQR
jgi:hypothetical protein